MSLRYQDTICPSCLLFRFKKIQGKAINKNREYGAFAFVVDEIQLSLWPQNHPVVSTLQSGKESRFFFHKQQCYELGVNHSLLVNMSYHYKTTQRVKGRVKCHLSHKAWARILQEIWSKFGKCGRRYIFLELEAGKGWKQVCKTGYLGRVFMFRLFRQTLTSAWSGGL